MTMFDVYTVYQSCRMNYFGKLYRRPKNVIGKVELLIPDNQIYLQQITKVFNDSNINPELYFNCGFELYGKKFVYKCFFNDKIMKVYKEKQISLIKHNEHIIKSFKKSYEYMKNYMRNSKKQISQFLQYCYEDIDGELAPIYHFKHGYICKYFITWLVWRNLLSHKDNPIEDQYRKLLDELKCTNTIPM